ncbi:MAG: hypothetical protein HZA90_29035 [Verrucomicrobia bacterium]|nr:hypothetical protein [Verrucomicrobiota bacterium]
MRRSLPFLAATSWLASCLGTHAGDLVLDYHFDPTNAVLTLGLPPEPRAYYTLEWTTDFQSFTNVGMSLGSPAPVWSYAVAFGPPHGFFRVRAHDIFSPLDSDSDGIDDRYELQHRNCLNPLDYYDASQPCLTNGLSNYQFYLRDLFGGPGTAPQFYSHEASVFNFGAPTAAREAISQELSVYSAYPGSGPPMSDINQVYSREATLWNFGSPSARVEAISREATLWNFGSPSANIEAISKEVAVYNAHPGSGPPMTEFNQVYSRELTLFNFGQPTATWEAISREVTVLNFEDPVHP